MLEETGLSTEASVYGVVAGSEFEKAAQDMFAANRAWQSAILKCVAPREDCIGDVLNEHRQIFVDLMTHVAGMQWRLPAARR